MSTPKQPICPHSGFIAAILLVAAAPSPPARATGPTTTQTVAKTSRISLAAAGDVIFGRMYGRKLSNFGYNRPFQYVRSLISRHDIAMCNLETPITARRHRWMARSILVFRALPRAAQLLRQSGFNLMITANNHSRDQGDKGLLETLAHLKRVSLPWVGTGRSARRAWKPYIFEKNGVKVGIIAFTNIRNYKRPMHRGFFAYVSSGRVKQIISWRIKKLKPKVDFVVVVGHYGQEWKHKTSLRERRWVRAMAKAGCDLFIGHHPHVLRGIQRIGKMVAYYSLGNFMFDLNWQAVRESGLARVVFVKDAKGARLERAEFIPIYIGNDYRPRRATGVQARQIINKMVGYSNIPGPRTKFWKGKGRLSVVLK